MHPLKHTTILITLLGNQDPTGGSLQEKILKKTPLGITHIRHGVMCLNTILCHLEELKWPPMPTKTNHTSLQGVPQNTKGESTPIENGINRLNISKMCKYVMSHQTGGFNVWVWITSGRTLLYAMEVTLLPMQLKNTLAFKSVHYLWIHDGDLWVADTANASIGLRFILPDESSPVFIHLLRDESLGIMNNGQRICKAMQSCALTQRQSLARGTNNHIFTENGNKYCCIGA